MILRICTAFKAFHSKKVPISEILTSIPIKRSQLLASSQVWCSQFSCWCYLCLPSSWACRQATLSTCSCLMRRSKRSILKRSNRCEQNSSSRQLLRSTARTQNFTASTSRNRSLGKLLTTSGRPATPRYFQPLGESARQESCRRITRNRTKSRSGLKTLRFCCEFPSSWLISWRSFSQWTSLMND